MPPTAATDCELVAAVRAGDDGAFEELYRRYSHRVAAFVYGFVRDEGRAEDVTQEAFLSALRRMRQTDSGIAFRPWIYEIARNAAIDLHRRTSRAEEVPIDGDAQLPLADRLRLVGSIAPEHALVGKERFENLRGALDELSETHHRIIVLREMEGLSYREIGDRMDLTAPAVESTLFRARRRLEQEYSELDTGRRCASMRSVIARLAEGIELPRERRRLERHALRCSPCRKRARELGVDPMRRSGVISRAAALLPLPALLRRRVEASWTAAAGSAAESTGAMAGKAGALLAAAVLAGGGGATLGGVGPLAPSQVEPVAPPALGPADAPARGGPAKQRKGAAKQRKGAATEAARTRRRAERAIRAPTPVKGQNGTGLQQQTTPSSEEPAPPAGTSLEQGLPQVPPIEQQEQKQEPEGEFTVPPVEVPPPPPLPEAEQEPVGALGATAGAATGGLPSIE